MSVHIIVDGYNLLRNSKISSLFYSVNVPIERDSLIDALAIYKKIKKYTITVVFDGNSKYSLYDERDSINGIDIIFSTKKESADGVIKRMAEKERERAIVVSSDNEVLKFAESAGSSIISSGDFAKKIIKAHYVFYGFSEEEEESKKKSSTKKKGPSKRNPKNKRKNSLKINKL
ncbi:MAG: NYN domain-containing protein [Desulfobacterales bacterium]|nr:NYN domain-containing protein [Desulfobacterales bacterium]